MVLDAPNLNGLKLLFDNDSFLELSKYLKQSRIVEVFIVHGIDEVNKVEYLNGGVGPSKGNDGNLTKEGNEAN